MTIRFRRKENHMLTTRHFTLLLITAGAIAGGCTVLEPETEDKAASAEKMIKTLDLEAHVEGGYFRRTYQSDHRDMIETDDGERFLLTSIYYLLTDSSSVGHMHINKSDILHYFQFGDPIRYTLIHQDGSMEQVTLGHDVKAGHRLQLHVPGGVWKASELLEGEYGYGLISEAVSPGFDFNDMKLGEPEVLTRKFPQHSSLIQKLTNDR